MRKFSVLLFVVIFFIPVFVYGLTGSASPKSHGLVASIKKFSPVSKVLSIGQTEVAKSLSFDSMLPDDPFFPAPNGIRGKITEISMNERMIFVKDAIYFNEQKQIHERADFHIYTNQETDFYINMIPEGTFEDLQIGDEIVSKGSINFVDFTSRNSVAIYKGKLVNSEDKRFVDFVGVVTELDKTRMSFIVPGLPNFRVTLNEQSKCFDTLIQNQESVSNFLGFRIMPDWVKDGTRVRGVIIASPGLTEYFADIIYFSKE